MTYVVLSRPGARLENSIIDRNQARFCVSWAPQLQAICIELSERETKRSRVYSGG